MTTESMVIRSMYVVLFAVAVVCPAAAAEPLPGAGTTLELQEVDGVDLDDLLARADASGQRFAEVIQDLTTEETYTNLNYDDEGRETERRVFVSRLMIHRLTHGRIPDLPGGPWIEYRHVLSVDGREAGDLEERMHALTRGLANASSASEERELIERESGKFGLAPRTRGMTLGTERFFKNAERKVFDAMIADRETIDGMDFIVVDYRQIRDTPRFRFDIRELSETARAYVRGRLWLKASTGDLWRDEAGIFVEGLPGFSEEPALLKYEFQYARSSYGIFTPERFEFTQYQPREFVLSERVIQEFAPFERFSVDVQFLPEEPIQ